MPTALYSPHNANGGLFVFLPHLKWQDCSSSYLSLPLVLHEFDREATNKNLLVGQKEY